jgi:hypothetical protein
VKQWLIREYDYAGRSRTRGYPSDGYRRSALLDSYARYRGLKRVELVDPPEGEVVGMGSASLRRRTDREGDLA